MFETGLKRITDHLTMEGHAQELQGIEDRLYIYSTIGTNTLLTKRDQSGEVSLTGIVQRILLMTDMVFDSTYHRPMVPSKNPASVNRPF